MKNDEILTVEEAKKYLKIESSLIYYLLRAGKIPASKIGRVWRLRKSRLDEWLEQQEQLNNHR